MGTTKQPKPVDAAVGARLRSLRMERGMSQERIGNAVGLTFQQIQKYEKGFNRIGASRLMQFAEVLGVSAASFFEGLNGQGAAPTDPENPSLYELTDKPGAFKLLRAYNAITDNDVRLALQWMAEACARNKAGLGLPLNVVRHYRKAKPS
jgi:transcriptional regulator with XRE-family HTH domain